MDATGKTLSVTQSLALPTSVQPYATATFTGLSFYVPSGSSSDLTVSVSTPTIASGSSSISGAGISVLIDNKVGFQAIDASGSATTTPGFIATPILSTMPEKVIEDMVQRVPLKRLGQPQDIANVYAFLASDDAAYVNGAVLEVSGGMTV